MQLCHKNNKFCSFLKTCKHFLSLKQLCLAFYPSLPVTFQQFSNSVLTVI